MSITKGVNKSIEVVEAIEQEPDTEFTSETVIESLEGLREEVNQDE